MCLCDECVLKTLATLELRVERKQKRIAIQTL